MQSRSKVAALLIPQAQGANHACLKRSSKAAVQALLCRQPQSRSIAVSSSCSTMMLLQAHRWSLQLRYQQPNAGLKQPRTVAVNARYRRASQLPAGKRLRLRRTLQVDEDEGEQEDQVEEAVQEDLADARHSTKQPASTAQKLAQQDADRRASGAQASTSTSSSSPSSSSSTPTTIHTRTQQQQQQPQQQQPADGNTSQQQSSGLARQTYASCLPAGIRAAGVEAGAGGRVVLDSVYANRNAAIATALQLAGAWVPPSSKPPSQPKGKKGLVVTPDPSELSSTHSSAPSQPPSVMPAVKERSTIGSTTTVDQVLPSPSSSSTPSSPSSSSSANSSATSGKDASWKDMIRNSVPVNGTAPKHSPQPSSTAAAPSQSKGSGTEANGSQMEIGDWTSALQASGFVVRTSPTGEVYLERTAATPKGQSTPQAPTTQSTLSPPPTALPAPASAQVPNLTARAPSTTAAGGRAPSSSGATKPPVAARQAAVIGAGMQASVTSQAKGGGVATATANKQQASAASAGRMALPAADPRQAPGLKAALRALETPEQVLDVAAALFPRWALSGCRLAAPDLLQLAAAEAVVKQEEHSSSASNTASPGSMPNATVQMQSKQQDSKGTTHDSPKGGRPHLGLAPTPAQAAQLLQALGIACQRRRWSTARRLELCGDPRVAGLVEALLLGPPRLSMEQSASPSLSSAITAAASQAARRYWVAPVPPVVPPAVQSTQKAVQSSPQTVQSSQQAGQSSQEAGQHQTLQGKRQQNPAGMDSDYERILQRYNNRSGTGGAVQGPGQGQQYKQDTPQSIRHQALVAAMWALACLGGPSLFQSEMEGLLALSKAGATTWSFGPGEGGSVLWALAHARHYTPRLADIERGLVQDGGMAVRTPSEVSRLLWSFATLNYRPSRLLATVRPGWAWSSGTASGGVESFTTEELATVAWSLAVLRALHPVSGVASGQHTNSSTSSSTTGVTASKPAQPLSQAAAVPAQQHQTRQQPALSVWAELCGRAKEVEAAGDIVLTQVWQTAMAIRLDAAPSSASSAVSQTSTTTTTSATNSNPSKAGMRLSGSSRSDALSATIDAALDYRALAQQQQQLGQQQQQQDPGVQQLQGQQGQGSGNTAELAGAARAMLQKAARSFAAGTAALQARSNSSWSSSSSSSLNSQSGAAGSAGTGTSGHSAYQRQIGASLARLRLMHVLEDCTSGYAIDVTLPSMRIAIEADGPSHFSRTPHAPHAGAPTPVVLGPTAMKRRHLRALGWYLISVKWQDWDRLSLPGSRERFLHAAINRVLASQMEAALQETDTQQQQQQQQPGVQQQQQQQQQQQEGAQHQPRAQRQSAEAL